MTSLPLGEMSIAASNMFASLIYWAGWGFAALLLMGAFIAFFMFMQFDHKVDVYHLYGSGKDGVFSVGKKKSNRVKWIKNKTAWRSLFPLFNKKEIEPFDSEFIYPGKQIYAFDLNGDWIPGRININKEEEQLRAEVNPVPYYVRNWQSLQHKKNAQEFAEHNFWEDNKYFFMVIITAVLCLIMVGLTVYFTYQFATGGAGAMNNLASALRDFNVIPGRGPGG